LTRNAVASDEWLVASGPGRRDASAALISAALGTSFALPLRRLTCRSKLRQEQSGSKLPHSKAGLRPAPRPARTPALHLQEFAEALGLGAADGDFALFLIAHA